MNKNNRSIIVIFLVFLLASLACSAVTGIGEQLGEARNTAEAAATEVHEGMDMLGTARAIGTQVGGSALIETAQALATELGESEFLKTAQAYATEQGPALLQTAQDFATQEGPGMLETAKAFATQDAPGYLETAQAFATQQGPEFEETAQALATQIASSLGEPPADIPLVEGERNQFYGIENLVFYLTPMPYADVLAFYKQQMPVNGWVEAEQGSFESDNAAVLMYEKEGRQASIALSVDPVNHHTVVLITLLGQ